jgi:TolB-like protein
MPEELLSTVLTYRRLGLRREDTSGFLCHNGLVIFFALLVFLLWGCAKKEVLKKDLQPGKKGYPIAVLPFENLTAMSAPVREVRTALIDRLKGLGFDVLEEAALQEIMAKHRIRYVGGIDQATAQAFKTDAGVEGVLLTSLEMFYESLPPKFAMTSRLVSTGEKSAILWMDGVGMAGDDSPGILGLGLVEDPRTLMDNALRSLSNSLARYVREGKGPVPGRGRERRFEPEIAYRSPEIEPGKKYTLAIIPFINVTNRRNAGEIVVLQFTRELTKLENLNVLEFGVVRQRLLNARVIIQEGIALTDVDAVAINLEADFVMTGRVEDYQDYEGYGVVPKIDFSVQILERKSRKVVWSSHSHNAGNDGVFFFDRGLINTTHVMMGRMIDTIGRRISEEDNSTSKEISPPPP